MCNEEIKTEKSIDYIINILKQMKGSEKVEENNKMKTQSFQMLMQKYQIKKIQHKESAKKSSIIKDRRIKDEEERQKKWLSLIRKAEAERKANELKKVKKIALSYVICSNSIQLLGK